jgi:PST family polysaccharide transporter
MIGPFNQTMIATVIAIVITVVALVSYCFFPRRAKVTESHTVEPKKHTYGQILHSTALIGGSSILNIAVGIVGTKAMAVLLGPAGFGLLAIYNSIVELAQNVASMGINGSGVRQIASAVGSGDTNQIAQTTSALRRTSIILGLFGAILLIGFSAPVSTLAFGTDQHASAIVVLSAAVLFRCVAAGQGALIQGMRRISDLAKMRVLGAVFGTIISIPVVYFLREDGIAPSIAAVAATTIVTSWWYSRKIRIQTQPMTVSQLGKEATALLKLGFAFMATGLMMSSATFAVRVLVLRKVGFEAAGLYQSAWTLGGLYVGFILDAMGTDFYPRLTDVAEDNAACNRLVNEQTQVSLLMAAAGVMATLTFSPLVITLFYGPKFYEAADVLRWLCLGMALRIISWPLGFILLAKGARHVFFWSELAWTVIYLAMSWVCITFFGLVGAGIAFFGCNIFHTLMNYLIVRRLSDFRWSMTNKRIGLLFVSLIGAVFSSFYVLPSLLAMLLGTLALTFSAVYSVRALLNLVGLDDLPRPLQQLISYFNFARLSNT